MPEPSWAPQRRTQTYRDLVARTANLVSHELPVADLIVAARELIAEFFAASTAIVVVGDGAGSEAALAELRDTRLADSHAAGLAR